MYIPSVFICFGENEYLCRQGHFILLSSLLLYTKNRKDKGDKMSDILDSGKTPMQTVLKMAVPSILEQLLVSLASLIDTAMVGTLGAAATASIGINASTVWLILGFITAVSVSFMFMVARKIGEGRIDDAKKAARESIVFSTLFGAVLAAGVYAVSAKLPIWLGAEGEVIPLADIYMKIVGISFLFLTITNVLSSVLRSAGNAKIPLAVNTAANVLNIIGNLFLINSQIDLNMIGIDVVIKGAGLGVEGAALSTLFSRIFSAVVFIVCMYKVNTPIKLELKGDYRLTAANMKNMVIIGIPTAMERCSLSIGAIILTAMISTMGTVSIAAHHLTNQIESILYLPAYGIAFTATTLIGQAIGAGRKDMADKFAWLCVKLNLALILAVCIPIFIFASPIVGVFTPSAEVIELGKTTLRLAAGFEMFFSTFVVISGICRGSADVKMPLIVSTVGVWVVRLELAYVFGIMLEGGLIGVWIGISCDVVFRGVMMLVRLKSKKWMTSTFKTA